MSSTNRGYDRHKVDYYVTPKQPIKEFLGHFFEDCARSGVIDDVVDIGGRPDKCRWFDPCAGGDQYHDMSYPAVLRTEFSNDLDITTLDIRQDSRAEIKADYLTYKPDYEPDIIITNPPFYIAQAVIEKALTHVRDGGFVAVLLRLNFFGGKERKKFWDAQMPIITYVHQRRMSFTDDRKTDSIEYMHAVWQRGLEPEFTMLKII